MHTAQGEPAVNRPLFGWKCCFCGKKRRGSIYQSSKERKEIGVVSWSVEIPRRGQYEPSYNETHFRAYHPQCLKNVLWSPEIYGHQQTDMALEIVDRLEVRAGQEKAYALSVLKGKVATLKEEKKRISRAQEGYCKLSKLL